MPLVSVIIPTYNRSRLLKRAIESILSQTFTDLEIIIVDDHSNDDTEQIIIDFNNNKLKYIKLAHNTGGSLIPRQTALSLSKSKYVAVLDDDDFWFDNDKLAKQISYLENHPECVMVGTDWVTVSGNSTRYYNLPKTYEHIKRRLLFRNCFYHSSVVYRRNIMTEIGGYHVINSGCYRNYSNDYEVWMKMGEKGEIVNLPIYGTGRDYSPIAKLNIKNQVYYMFNHMGLISKYKNSYYRYYLAMVFRVIVVFYSILLNNRLKTTIFNGRVKA